MENLLDMKIILNQWSGYERQKQNKLFSDIYLERVRELQYGATLLRFNN